jgi:hypothetical protein
MVEARCMKCRKKVEMKDGNLVIMKNGNKMMKGRCPECKTIVCRILKKEKPVENAL